MDYVGASANLVIDHFPRIVAFAISAYVSNNIHNHIKDDDKTNYISIFLLRDCIGASLGFFTSYCIQETWTRVAAVSGAAFIFIKEFGKTDGVPVPVEHTGSLGFAIGTCIQPLTNQFSLITIPVISCLASSTIQSALSYLNTLPPPAATRP